MLTIENVKKNISRLHPDPDVQDALRNNGFVSALQIPKMTESHFVQKHAQPLGVSEQTARQIHRNAVRVHDKVMHMLVNVKSTIGSPYFRNMRVSNVGGDVASYFEALPSYQELFGSLNYCECEECKSIFGPAAYLVDLLRIIDKYVTQPNAATIPADLTLNARRPDIQNIELTCANTNTLIPYLQIVNERLLDASKSYLASNPFFALATTTDYPLNLPFNLPLNQIRVYLAQIGLELSDIYKTWQIAVDMTAREKLGLSLEQYNLFVKKASDDDLATYYGLANKSELSQLSQVSTFLEQTGFMLNQLNDLLRQNLSDDEAKNNIAHNFYINQGLATGEYLYRKENDGAPETIENMNNDALDRINRFVRLSEKANIAFVDLDWAIRMAVNGGNLDINAQVLTAISQIVDLAGKMEIDIATFCGLIGSIKTYGEGDTEDGVSQVPFDKIFNAPGALLDGAPYHPKGNPLNPMYKDEYKSWTAGGNDQDISGWLAGSLHISLDDLNSLGTSLFGSTPQNLTVDVLSMLFRHTLLLKHFDMRMEEYLIYLDLCNLGTTKLFTLDNIASLLDTFAAMDDAGLNVYQLDYFVNGNSSAYVSPLYTDSSVHPWLQSLWTSTPGTLDSEKAESTVEEALANYLNAAKEMIHSTMVIVNKAVALPAGVDFWADAFLAKPADMSDPSPYQSYIDSVLQYLSRWLSLVNDFDLPQQLLASIGTYPECYGFAGLASYSVQDVFSVYGFNQFFTTFSDVDYKLLNYVEAVAKKDAQATKILVAVTGWDQSQTQQLLDTVVKNQPNLTTQIQMLSACFAITGTLKADVTYVTDLTTLNDLSAQEWTTYEEMASKTLQKIQGKYASSQWQSVLAKMEGEIGLATRDALLAIVLWQLHQKYPDITTPENVYEFLLIDVEMGAITQISYIKEALNATQLYLQRCQLKIEQGVEILDIPNSWWSWMMHYRVWEANREIFVYPENYLVPSIRHTKTELFQNLENDLQQSEITDAYVQTAYRKYINSFSELAKLKPFQTLHCMVNDVERGKVKTLFVLGRTKSQPYTYYVCSQQEGLPWTEWEKIDVDIQSQYLTPVYAFSRLFIFWSELKKSTSSSIDASGGQSKSADSYTYKVTIKYSFLDLQNKWVNPQTLVSEEIVYYVSSEETDPLTELAPFKGLFDMDELPWLKLYAFAATSDNLEAFDVKQQSFERICLLYGPFLNNSGTVLELTPPQLSSTNKVAFEEELYARARNFNNMLESYDSGHLPLNPNLALNPDIERDYFIRRNEFLLLDEYTAAQPPLSYRAVVNDLSSVLEIAYARNVIFENYLSEMGDKTPPNLKQQNIDGNSFTSDTIDHTLSTSIFNALKAAKVVSGTGEISETALLTLDLMDVFKDLLDKKEIMPNQFYEVQKVLYANVGSLALFNNVPQTAKVIAVQNQPGSFVYDNSDESFLLAPQPKKITGAPSQPRFSMIEEGLLMTRPLINKVSFVSLGLSVDVSGEVFDTLKMYNLVNDQGITDVPQATLSMVQMVLGNMKIQNKINDDQINSVYKILQNFPLVYPEIFTSSDISVDVSRDIYGAVQVYSLIDKYNLVDLDLLTGTNLMMVLSNLIIQGKLTADQVPGIYKILYQAPTATSAKYWNKDADATIKSLSAYHFDVTRLTTSAIEPLSRHLFTGGIDRLLSLSSQQIPVVPVLPFDRLAPNTTNVNYPTAVDGTQVDFDGLYGEYFWEVFYHVPMLIAYSLNGNQQFQDAMKWFQYIFNPTLLEDFINKDTFSVETRQIISPSSSEAIFNELQAHNIGSPPAPIIDSSGRVNPQFTASTDLSFLQKDAVTADMVIMVRNVLLNYQLATPASHYWQFQPFRMHVLESLTQMLSDDNPAVMVYNDDPFDPYAIARLRIGAFEKSTVMQYIDNLIKWGDQQFTQDSWESITSATMLYVYAYDLLGPRPVDLGACPTSEPATFKNIQDKYKDQPGGIPQFLIDIENLVPGSTDQPNLALAKGFNDLDVYFCVPENATFVGYWDIVEDRLYKIRNSMNIDGEVRQLPLFQPPIDPMLLAKAAAASNNVLGVVEQQQTEVAPYRFRPLLNSAKEITSYLIQLGSSLLAAIEKKDAEDLSLLHNTQEATILDLTTTLKNNSIEQLNDNLKSLQTSLESAQYRLQYYTDLIKNGLSVEELTNLSAMEEALAFNILASVLQTAASIGYAIPQVGSPFAMTYGGIQVGSMVQASAGAAQVGAEISSFIAQSSLTMAGYQRRKQDWTLQKELANYEVQNLQQQISALQVQIASAQQDLKIHQKSIEQNQKINDFLKSKFSNADLYQWMINTLSATYYQTYQATMELALKAQKAFQFDMDVDTTFLNFNYWDSLRKGLLCGENINLALDQMNSAYIQQNTRRLEIEKTISLSLIAPRALLDLKANGKCSFELTEESFDYDYPGQYARKIKNLSISIPAVLGPYQNLKATLCQTYNAVVTEPDIKVADYLLDNMSGDKPKSGLRENWIQNQKIAISRGINDSGLFVLDFNDERYLPFENTGAVSKWEFEMPKETNRFNFDSISDVIINLKYTALYDGNLQTNVEKSLAKYPYEGGLYYVLQQAFSSAWYSFMTNHSDPNTQVLSFTIDPKELGYFEKVTLKSVQLKVDVASDITMPATSQFMSLTIVSQPAKPIPMTKDIGEVDGLNLNLQGFDGIWSITVDLASIKQDPALAQLLKDGEYLDPDKFQGMEMIMLYEGKVY